MFAVRSAFGTAFLKALMYRKFVARSTSEFKAHSLSVLVRSMTALTSSPGQRPIGGSLAVLHCLGYFRHVYFAKHLSLLFPQESLFWARAHLPSSFWRSASSARTIIFSSIRLIPGVRELKQETAETGFLAVLTSSATGTGHRKIFRLERASI